MPNVSRRASSALGIPSADSSTALSWGQPLADSDLSMPRASSIRSISALLNSLPRSVWNISMSGIGKEGVANAGLTGRASFPGPAEWPTIPPVAGVDEQAGAAPRGPDAHVGQVAAYMGARRPAAEAARDDARRVGLVDRPGLHLGPLPAACADRAVLPHDAAGPAPADGDARPPGRRLYLARAAPGHGPEGPLR